MKTIRTMILLVLLATAGMSCEDELVQPAGAQAIEIQETGVDQADPQRLGNKKLQ